MISALTTTSSSRALLCLFVLKRRRPWLKNFIMWCWFTSQTSEAEGKDLKLSSLMWVCRRSLSFVSFTSSHNSMLNRAIALPVINFAAFLYRKHLFRCLVELHRSSMLCETRPCRHTFEHVVLYVFDQNRSLDYTTLLHVVGTICYYTQWLPRCWVQSWTVMTLPQNSTVILETRRATMSMLTLFGTPVLNYTSTEKLPPMTEISFYQIHQRPMTWDKVCFPSRLSDQC